MTPEERARDRGRKKKSEMTPQQRERVRVKDRERWANRSPEQRERDRQRGRETRDKQRKIATLKAAAYDALMAELNNRSEA